MAREGWKGRTGAVSALHVEEKWKEAKEAE